MEESNNTSLFAVFCKPTTIAKEVLANKGWGFFFGIILIASIVATADIYLMHYAKTLEAGNSFQFSFMKILVLFFAWFIVQLLMSYFLCGLVTLTGKWLGGKARFKQICITHAAAQIITISIAAINIILLGLHLGLGMIPTSILTLLSIPLSLISLTWFIVAYSHMLKVAQQYKSAWRGFGNMLLPWILLLPIVFVIGILAAIAIPTYVDYGNRVHVANALKQAAPIRAKITEHWMHKGTFPPGLNLAGDKQSRVKSLIVTKGTGKITITFRQKAFSDSKEYSLILKPTPNNGKLSWNCQGGSLPRMYRPARCRK